MGSHTPLQVLCRRVQESYIHQTERYILVKQSEVARSSVEERHILLMERHILLMERHILLMERHILAMKFEADRRPEHRRWTKEQHIL